VPREGFNPRTHFTVISVRVKPNARASVLEQLEGGDWLAQLKSQPGDEKANEELLSLLPATWVAPSRRS